MKLKYPGGVKGVDNHKKSICDDGVFIPIKPKRIGLVDPDVPCYPQPAGVYSQGLFHVLKFFEVIRAVWTFLVEDQVEPALLSIEHLSFIQFFNSRKLVLGDGPNDDPAARVVLFKIDGPQFGKRLTLSPPVPELTQVVNGVKYLRIDSLSGDRVQLAAKNASKDISEHSRGTASAQ